MVFSPRAVSVAALRGQAAVVNALLRLGVVPGRLALVDAVAGGSVAVAEEIRRRHGPRLDAGGALLEAAAARGDVPMLRWLMTMAVASGELAAAAAAAMAGAAANGHLEALQLLEPLLPEGTSCMAAVRAAARCGRIDCLRFLHERGLGGGSDVGGSDGSGGEADDGAVKAERGTALDEAAGAGHLHVVAFLHKLLPAGSAAAALALARRNGHASVAAYLVATEPEAVV
ncbi:unnamed protein product [Phaeothamnion confervicola]